MSSAAALSRISAELQTLLQEALRSDLMFQNLSVVLTDPSKPPVAEANTTRVSLWLYQVVPDEFLRNLPTTTVNSDRAANGKKPQVKLPPLALNLYYLLTPLTDSWDHDQRALGLAMLTFHRTPALLLHNPDEDVHEDLRIGLVSDQLEDRVRLWQALNVPYRLSVCYVVRTARLDPPAEDAGPRVRESVSDMGEPPAAPPTTGAE